MEQLNNRLQEQAKIYNKKITVCRRVKKLTSDKTWKDIIQPLLDAMIEDVVGGKSNNIYKNGHLCAPGKDYEYFTAYKQALMDFNNRVWGYTNSIEPLKKQVKSIEEKVLGKEKYTNPMLDGKYAEQGE